MRNRPFICGDFYVNEKLQKRRIHIVRIDGNYYFTTVGTFILRNNKKILGMVDKTWELKPKRYEI